MIESYRVCKRCEHFVQCSTQSENAYGVCRRYPPIVRSQDGTLFAFPEVDAKWYCGEFKYVNKSQKSQVKK